MSLQDSLFSEYVERDVEEFLVKEIRKRVLVFPPVNNYRRFLIHQFVQNKFQHLLFTFSIGQGPHRRTIVCYKTDLIRDPKLNGALSGTCSESKISDSANAMGVEGHRSSLVSPENSKQRQVKSVPSIGIYRPPPARKTRCDNQNDPRQDQTTSDSLQSSKANRQKRPDRAVYVPRHRRSNETDNSPLSRETSRVSKPPKERRSTTSSPAHTSCKSSVDNSGTGFECSGGIQGSNDENEACVDELNVSEADRTVESKIGSDFCETSIHRRAIDVEERGDEIIDDKSADSETCQASFEDREDLLTLNGAEEDSRDFHMSEIPVKVQSDAEILGELRKRDETGLIFNNCEGGETESVVTESKGITNMEKPNETEERYETGQDGDNFDLIMSGDSNKKEEQTKEEFLNRDEVVNHRNRRIVRQNLVSDVLLISDELPKGESVVEETLVVRTSQHKEKRIKKVERPKSKPAPPPSPPSKVNRDECDWDSLFDDNGDCLDPTLIEELTTAVGEVTIEQPKSDYRSYSKAPVEVSNDEFAHVIEIYNFPSDFKTSDLAAVFSPFKNGGFELKWVDDTHCLGVFSSPLIAAEVLGSDHSFVKTRPLSEATALSKAKARRSAASLQPYRARPETCAALARRLVTGALGVRLATARQEREREKIVLREAKERRRLANKQREDAWEGIIAEK